MSSSSPITVRFQRTEANPDLPLPRFMSTGAAGMDLAAAVPEPVTLNPGDIRLIPCGFRTALPLGYEAQIRPHSGLASRQGITLINSPGTIDADYRGEVQVPLINLGPQPVTIDRGMRIAQMIIQALPQVTVVEVDTLDPTARGQGGFGHTGTA